MLNLFYNENLYYSLEFYANPVFGKMFGPEIWAKIFPTNQIAKFFNQPYLQNKSMKYLDFLHLDTNSYKLKVDQKFFFGWLGSTWVWSVWSWDSKIDCISRMNQWNNLFQWFLGGHGQKWPGYLVPEILKTAVSEDWVYELSWFFACWPWCNNFWLDQDCTICLSLLNASLPQSNL